MHSTHDLLVKRIEAAGGALRFDDFMDTVLYAPGAGYYVNGSLKFGAAGDFVTAPELSPLFSRCLANQCAQGLAELHKDSPSAAHILEFGAGSGVMAAEMLRQLEQVEMLPQRYSILELSAELQQRQRDTLCHRVPHLLPQVEWITELPAPGWQGVVVANEVLDALPVQRFRVAAGGYEEQFVMFTPEGLALVWRKTQDRRLSAALEQLEQRVGALPEGYESEINLRLTGWMNAIGAFLHRGAVLLIDYGYSEREFYHPQRASGTLRCHFRQRAHYDPLALVGLQDMTADVDFSAVAQAGVDAGLELAGYTTQAHFLLANGLQQMLGEPIDAAGIERLQQIKQLTLPSAMGERFKVLGFSRGLSEDLQGFAGVDMRAYL